MAYFSIIKSIISWVINIRIFYNLCEFDSTKNFSWFKLEEGILFQRAGNQIKLGLRRGNTFEPAVLIFYTISALNFFLTLKIFQL